MTNDTARAKITYDYPIWEAGIRNAAQAFYDEIEQAIDKSSHDDLCCVELFTDGTYRTLYASQVGNGYREPNSIVLGIFPLDPDDDDDDPDLRFYDNSINAFRVHLEQAIQDRKDCIAA